MNENLKDKRGIVFSLLIASFLASFLGSAINIAIPIIGKEFKLDNVALTWLNTSFQLSSATFLLFFGKLADIKGRSKLYYLGISVFAVGVFFLFSLGTIYFYFSRELFRV
ncbi:MFS transporter [Dictyoglomus thermophilum]|uniref:Efflux PumP antibiotic resistance protein n=1 Tax=Dictyoglomus thermophilum (strain ATCC 35947 / DSM 3960 / H-6-12) TaxID=309799 RepID=B5YBX6_DICT6|nr:MFS transporter [Dictyoglomus thermophilum]ACI19012.1 efflux PumP antibiotic resistance protein [Dictyoglomus thermophilum H-6-12]